MIDDGLMGIILGAFGGMLVIDAYIMWFDAGGGLITEPETYLWLIPLVVGWPSLVYGAYLLTKSGERSQL